MAWTTIYAIAIGLLLTLAFFGYGQLLARMTGQPNRFDGGTKGALGLAAYLAFCGLIELCQLASVALFFVVTLLGIALAARDLRRWPQQFHLNRLTHKPILAVLLMLYVLLIIGIATWHFGNPDDLQGYLVMPERILQTGSTGLDPFLFRRIEAALGGSHYLFAIGLAFLDFTHLRIVDIGIGSLLLAIIVGRHAQDSQRGASLMALSLGLALIAVTFVPVVNLTPDICAMALLYAALKMALGLSRAETILQADHLLFGLLLFGLACLRTTYITPAAAVYAALYLTLVIGRKPWPAFKTALLTALFGLVLMVPWMVVCFRIAGTPLYPFLGLGTLSGAEVAGYASRIVLLRSLIVVGACYALAVGSVYWVLASRQARPATSIFLVAVTTLALAAIGLSQLKLTLYATRYSYVGLTTIPLFLFVESSHYSLPKSALRGVRVALMAAVALFVLVLVRAAPGTVRSGQLSWVHAGSMDDMHGGEALANLADPDQRAAVTAQIAALQNAVPPGKRILVRLDDPFLLNFRRNPIWVMDHPGVIGPAPGVPATDTAEAWLRYLSILKIPYLAYAYGNEAGDSVALGLWFTSHLSGPSHWQKTLQTRTASVQAMLLTLRTKQRTIYDDGTRYVLAISPDSQSIQPPNPSR